MTFDALTIVTSCVGYGKYLHEWATSIINQSVKPGRVCIFTHGSQKDSLQGSTAMMRLIGAGIASYHAHSDDRLDLGVARNRAVELAESEWVMHLDTDDMLFPDAVNNLQRCNGDADVVQAGYTRVGQIAGMSTKTRLYTGADGLAALDLPSLASGNSMFRRSFWEQSPYRTDMLGAWDTVLWLGFAHIGARFRPSTIPIFQYRQHMDSVFNQRRNTLGWSRVHTTAMLKAMRRKYEGVAVIVPRDHYPTPERERNWQRVKRHYELNHPTFQIIEGFCPSIKWVKGAAIADGMSRCSAEVVVIADADVMVDPVALVESVCWVGSGFPWSMPHRRVFRANTSVTDALCRTDEFQVPHESGLDRSVYEGAPGGGIVVLRHVMYDAIGGMPMAFQGWGSEDKCLALICDKLIGPCERGDADLVHLWHQPQTTMKNHTANVQLLQLLGYQAQQGRDALVQSLAALPKVTLGTFQPRRVQPIDHAKIQRRMEERRMR